MDWNHFYWIPSLTACLLCIVVAICLWPRRAGRGASILFVICLTIGLWSLGNTFQLAAAGLSTKIFWRGFQHLAIEPLPVLLLVFALVYSGRTAWLSPTKLILLSLLPAASLVLAWTNSFHGLMWSRTWLDTSGPFPLEASVHGLWFWVITGYNYLLLVITSFILIEASLRVYRLYRLQLITLIIGLAIPWLANLTFLTGLSPWPSLDLTPFSFCLAAILVAWAIYRYSFARNIPLSYEAVLQALTDPLFVLDEEGRIKAVNSAARHLLGLPDNLILGRDAVQLLDRDLSRTGPDHELALIGRDGRQRFFDLQTGPLKDKSGQDTGRLLVLRDISDRKKMEDTVRSSQEKLLKAFQGSPDGVVITRLSDGLIVEVNQTFHEKMFYTRDELVGETTTSINIWANPEDRNGFVEGLATPPHHVTMETEFRAKNGLIIPSYVSARLMEMDGEMHIVTVAVDITEQKALEAAHLARVQRVHRQQEAVIAMATAQVLEAGDLEPSAKLLTRQTARALDADQAALWLINEEAGLLECSCIYLSGEDVWVAADPIKMTKCPEYLDAVGSVRSLAVGRISGDPCLVEESSRRLTTNRAVSRIDAAVLLGGRMAGLLIVGSEDKTRQWFDDESAFVGQAADQVAQALANNQRARAEEALRFSEERYRFLIEHLPYGLFVATIPKGRFVYTNSTAQRWLGRHIGPLDQTDVWQVVATQDHQPLSRKLTDLLEHPETLPSTGIYSVKKADGNSVRLDVSMTPVQWEGSKAIMGFARDITEEEQLEKQLRQAQKMEAIGTLASGVAHDFNNLLQVISGYVQLLGFNRSLNEDGRQQVEKINTATEKAAGLINRLSAFTRKTEAEKQPLEAKELIERVVDMLSRTIPRMISIETDLPGQAVFINGDSTGLEQVLMNLGSNARDAMPEGGRISIAAQMIDVPDRGPSDQGPLAAGRWLEIRFSDTGQGMEAAIAARIFEPFFTTKTVGKGTGLGLSTAYGIIEGHGGRISCLSRPGRGTTFIIHLPLSRDRKKIETLETASPPKPPAGRGQTILVVDDEEPIRSVAVEALELHGYKPLTASTGEEALAIFKEKEAAIAMIILDLGMPGMGGAACLREMQTIRPDLKVLIASGYRAEELSDHLDNAEKYPFMAKPYRLTKLVEMVGRIIEDQIGGD